MGAGKDAVAALLSMVGYQRIAFADQVRVEVAETLGRGIVPPSLRASCIADDLTVSTAAEVYAKPTTERMRRILQFWGTNYRREQDPDYWVRRATATMPTGPVAFSDVRFPNEVEAIRKLGGVIWKIDRPVTLGGIPGHVSESAVDDIEPDAVIDNTGTMLQLAEAVRAKLSARSAGEYI